MLQVGYMPAALPDIIEPTFNRPIFLQRVLACQAEDDEIVGAAQVRRMLYDGRLVSRQPAPARVDILLVGHAAGDGEKLIHIDIRTQLLHFGGRARIILLYACSKW